MVKDGVDPSDRASVEALLEGRNLEDALSRLRRIGTLVGAGGTFDGLDHAAVQRLDAKICAIIINAVSLAHADVSSATRLARWAARTEYVKPIELFTVNYDLVLEAGLEEARVPYFDGFVGSLSAPFRDDLVDASVVEGGLPSSFVRLWKLHGSTNWVVNTSAGTRAVRRIGGTIPAAEPLAIYPTEEKYDDSRRLPFIVLMDRFRRALAEPESLIVVSGYSFGDQHLNDILFTAAEQHPRSEVVALCYDDIPPALQARAVDLLNITALARKRAIVGGVDEPWSGDPAPDVYTDAGEFLLGDFVSLARFLARSVKAEDGA